MKTLLLHTCCGPCGFSATKCLSDKFNIKYYWYNPNIQPLPEYEKRLSSAKKIFSLITDEYNNEIWMKKVTEISRQKDKRCVECYRLRLNKTAQKARELNADFFSTTLLISPYQRHDRLKKIGEDIARQVGVNFYYYDGRPDFYNNYNEFKKTGFYIQKYCGCTFSINEK